MIEADFIDASLREYRAEAFGIVKAIADHGPMGMTELATTADLPVSRTRVVVGLLRDAGYLVQPDGGIGRGRHGQYRIAQVPAWPGLAIDPRKLPRPRKCCKCRRSFMARDAFNRVCPTCADVNSRAGHGFDVAFG